MAEERSCCSMEEVIWRTWSVPVDGKGPARLPAAVAAAAAAAAAVPAVDLGTVPVPREVPPVVFDPAVVLDLEPALPEAWPPVAPPEVPADLVLVGAALPVAPVPVVPAPAAAGPSGPFPAADLGGGVIRIGSSGTKRTAGREERRRRRWSLYLTSRPERRSSL